jgi:hypothetical protein
MKLVMGNCYALYAQDKNKELYSTQASKSLKTKISFGGVKLSNYFLDKESSFIKIEK